MTRTLKKKRVTSTRKRKPRRVSQPQFFVLDGGAGWLGRLGKSRSVLCSDENEVAQALPLASKDSLWLSSRSETTEMLLRALRNSLVHDQHANQRIGSLLLLEGTTPKSIPFLRHWFHDLIGETPSFKTIPEDQLLDVIAAPPDERRDVFIGGFADPSVGLLVLVRGNLDRITVPLSIFRPSGTTRPNFRRFELDDYGHTVRFGDYEAAADFVLFESDPEFRRRLNAKRRVEDLGFGASHRRLRIQRGVSRDGFPGLSAKTIARIERGEVEKPHGRTLAIISETLGVDADDIESY